jgi:hypothetical protein
VSNQHWTWWPKDSAVPLASATTEEKLYALENKLSWLIKEICRVVFKLSKVAYGE